MSTVLEVLVIALLAAGAFFALVGSLGLLRLSDFLRRLHGPTKASTLGVGGVLIAAMLHRFASSGEIGLRELLITLFVFLTAPISAHLLAKAAMALEPSVRPKAPADARTEPEQGDR
ncbi:Na+/H+ antiporter subunit G [Pseudomarimonas salicorniae]|uniref:Na+/H+ antiporter subunit G n=1 Tax=Pseudomarimonas salicorniae TaxID=2933270 RepID=A0ABT0GLI5_9GAMM|nr:Na+/H+ antiporter subunit G [Lysobacter sp. CAU 1642]MCK7595094.1 Na+/H+ antiporter subunit G [Lysobacter sp. CAU 1642]